jgi:predicted house-cleaning noncanonical NTP pyrophosphatase (MazG superfamily)
LGLGQVNKQQINFMDFTPSNLPIENEYPKLVRDRIPEILAAKGLKAQTRVLTDDEYIKYLLKKMVEESTELLSSLEKGNMEEELADVLELIDAIVKFKVWKMEDIITIQKEKRQKNGGFEKKILLLEKP